MNPAIFRFVAPSLNAVVCDRERAERSICNSRPENSAARAECSQSEAQRAARRRMNAKGELRTQARVCDSSTCALKNSGGSRNSCRAVCRERPRDDSGSRDSPRFHAILPTSIDPIFLRLSAPIALPEDRRRTGTPANRVEHCEVVCGEART